MTFSAVLNPRRQQEHHKMQQEIGFGEGRGRENAISQECDLAPRGGEEAFCDEHGSETRKCCENT